MTTIAVGRLDPPVGCWLEHVLRHDRSICVLGSDLDDIALERAVAHDAPRVVILNDAIEYSLLVRLKSREQAPGVLVLTRELTRLLGTVVVAAGASCLGCDASPPVILEAVHRAAHGDSFFVSPDGSRSECYPRETPRLTDREVDVLAYLSQGRAYAEIALAMQLTLPTIRTHSARIRDKFGVKTKRDLIGITIPHRPIGVQTNN